MGAKQMNKSEQEFMEECAERAGLNLAELTEADAKFWSVSDE
jgi:hypothetical protein